MASLIGLKRRLANLERQTSAARPERCQSCGLPHMPAEISLELARSIIGPPNWTSPEQAAEWQRRYPPPGPLCLCDCCAEGRPLAELTHRQRNPPLGRT